MTELLSRLFVKNHQDANNPAVRTAYGTMVSITGIILNLILLKNDKIAIFISKLFVVDTVTKKSYIK